MSFGLETYNESGVKVLGSNQRILRHVGTYTYSLPSNGSTQTITIPGIANDGTWVILDNQNAATIVINTGSITLTRSAQQSAMSPGGYLLVMRY